MMDITVKTLDGQNRTYSVPEDTTVKQFKEKIAGSINISVETQRLIFQGKVLQDDKLIKDYDVHGKVVHVVVRAPPSASRPSTTTDNPQPNTTTPGRDVNSIVVGSFTLPSDILDANMVQGIARDAITSMGEMGRNARVTTRTSSDGSALDVHIHLGPIMGQTVSEAQMRLDTARTMIRLANDSLERLETSSPSGGSRSGTPRASSPAQSREAASNSTETEPTETPSRLSPMDTTEEPSSSQPSAEGVESSPDVGSTQTESETTSSANQSDATANSSQSDGGTSSESPPTQQQNGQPVPPVRPNIAALAEILTEFNEVNTRLQPHMQRFTEIVRSDAEMNAQEQRENQLVCNHVSEVMHAFGHGYHALSDLMVDLSQARPRRLYVTLAIAHPHTTVIQQTIPVQVAVPIVRNGSSTSTSSTGTSTIPNPSTTETGTQPTNPVTTETGTQPSAGAGTQGDGDDLDRISQEMRAGLQNVLGQNLRQGDGSPDNPYVFVEMGPDRMTVNSISAQVVTSTDDEEGDNTETTTSNTSSNPPRSTSTNATPSATTTTTTTGAGAQFAQGLSQAGLPQNLIQGIMQMAGSQAGQPQGMMINIGQGPGSQPGMVFSSSNGTTTSASTGSSTTNGNPTTTTNTGPQVNISQGFGQAGLPPNFLQNIIQQTLREAAGSGQPQRMQINIGPGGVPQMGAPGMPMGFRLGPHMMRAGVPAPGGVRNESGTQTAGANGVPSNSGTQTSNAPTSTFGTQTSSSSPSSTSGTQTPSVSTAFVMPGGIMGGAPAGLPAGLTGLPAGLTGLPAGLTGNMPTGMGLNPADPYLPCSSRHFLTRHASNILNNSNGNQQNNDTVLADMVGNLMSGLLGGVTGTGSTASTASTTTSSSSGAGTGTRTTGGTGQPRPATGVNASTFRMGVPQPRPGTPLFRGPVTLGNLFPGRMPQLTGMRFRVRRPNDPVQVPAAGTQPTTAANTASSQTSTPSTSTASTAEPQFVQMLRTMLQQSSQRPRTETTQATSTTPSTTAGTTTDQNQNVQTGTGNQPISDEAFTQLVSGITNYMSQAAVGQAPAQTIGDFIRNLGENYAMPQGEGFINDTLSCILAHLQITDMLQLLYGNPAVLNQVQAPLREFLTSRVLEDDPPTEENIRSGVSYLIENMQNDIQEMVNTAAPRPHIDFLSTTNRFLGQQLFNVVFLILNSREGDANFGRDLYACVRRLLAEMFILCSRCLGGMPQVERFVNQRLRNLITDVNPVIQEWMSTVTRRQLSTFIPTITVTEGEVSVYLVNKRPGQPSVSSTAATQSRKASAAKKKEADPPSSSEDKPRVAKESAKRDPSPLRAPSPKRLNKEKELVKSPTTPMETSPLISSPGASEMEVETQKQSQAVSKGAEASEVSQPKSTPSSENQPSPSGAQASSNGDWHGVVPADWVPVITRDIDAHKAKPKQSPYSDVYLQGMPPKRRRLMTQDRPSNISNTSEVLPDSLRRAVAAAAVEPISNMDNLISEINNDSELQQSFESQVSSTIVDRLNKDSDYKEERFPGSTEYYHKTNDRKK